MLHDKFFSELREALRRPGRAVEFAILCAHEIKSWSIHTETPPASPLHVTSNTVFLVSSTIRPSANRLSYGNSRSVFTPAERLDQTFATIDSIRRHAPPCQIVLLENSSITDSEDRQLSVCCDAVLRFDSDPAARHLRDSPFKGAGEAYMLLAAFERLAGAAHGRCFKISGRYRLRESFDPSSYSDKLMGFSVGPGPCFSTRLFCVPSASTLLFAGALRQALPRTMAGMSIEKALYIGLPRAAVQAQAVLGVEGETAVSADRIIE